MASNYMVRAMESHQDDFDVFFRGSVVAVGWSRVNFAEFNSSKDVVRAVVLEYYSNKNVDPRTVGKKKNQARRFKDIQSGDRILVPYWSSVLLATAQGKEKFNEHDGEKRDLANQHVVEFMLDADGERFSVPRKHLSQGLQRRLRVPGSAVSDLRDFDEEIGQLFRGEAYTSTIARMQVEQEGRFKEKLLAVLQDGTSALQAGGIGLEELVAELLRADGYDAQKQAKNRFPGIADADIEAIKVDHVTSVKLLVQVKHHSGKTGTWGAKQLAHILETQRDLFAEYQLVLVTSGNAPDDLRNLCESKDIILMAGDRLVEWITDCLTHLDPKTRSKLRISDVPQIVEEMPSRG